MSVGPLSVRRGSGSRAGGAPRRLPLTANYWLDALHAENNNALRPVTEELQALSEAISRNDAAAMSKAFITLGNLTSQLALGLHSFAGLGDKLRELSQKLASAGGNLLTIAQQRASGSAPATHQH